MGTHQACGLSFTRQADANTARLLESYKDARETVGSSGNVRRGSEYGPPLMSELWHATCPKNCITRRSCRSPYVRLEWLLGRLRDEHAVQHQHVVGRFVNAYDTVISVTVVRTRHGFTAALPEHTVARGDVAVQVGDRMGKIAVRKYPPWVLPQEVVRGVGWLTDQMRGKVDIPYEILRDAA